MIEVRIALFTERGSPAGPRLLADNAPAIEFSFPATKEGLAAAKEAAEKLNAYLARPNLSQLQHRSGVGK